MRDERVSGTGGGSGELVTVHRVFRREFGLLPRMVAGVRPGNVERSELVAGHVAELVQALSAHVRAEDELLWPKLRERSGSPATAGLVERLEGEHDQLRILLDRVRVLLPMWSSAADGRTRDELVATLSEATRVLEAHLDAEEAEVLPIADQHVAREEWDELGRAGVAGIPRERLPVFLGAVLEEASGEERSRFLGHVPLPGRLAYLLVGQRRYRAETTTLRSGL
ncbi:hemerythrin-like domain-containing protein [Motilibacter rhizosphaerae]|uniref:Hemerythrin-like domain-containing protein n=1 Tax=Motilibacter rhizosphaerae TaxID=598652 RepID=A0A4Q7NRJ6_9ACTN|nr:hemerythrin domain-containing protein [Motilibacter rhizosphaerae]RZS89687.1 hemerythrin-like domain-containing protein [Motilibacter rhizosphaerae]